MNKLQEVTLCGKTYRVVESRTHFSKDPIDKTFTYTAECCIRATDIVDISPWVMKGEESTDVMLRTTWFHPNGTERSWVTFTLQGSRCTEFQENYNSELEDILLWFHFEAREVTRTDSSEEAIINIPINQ